MLINKALPDIISPSSSLKAPLLKMPSQKVDFPLSEDMNKCINNMMELLKTLGDGAVGLSAIQIGVAKQICLVQTPQKNYKVLINPEIINFNRNMISKKTEGCLSLPGFFTTVKRYKEIVVRYYDSEGKEINEKFFGQTARIIQHELDHLRGRILDFYT